MLNRISTMDAMFIALMAACGVALKPVVGIAARFIGSALVMPGGIVAGAVYMLLPMLALLVVQRFGAAFMVGFMEAIIVIVTGSYGSHGIMSLITYTTPCLVIELVYFAISKIRYRWLLFLPTGAGNMAGTALIGIFFMRLPLIPLLISLVPAFVFGGLGGIFASRIYDLLIKSFPQFEKSF
ncbi:ECF transporter S component [candidate division KSB1 bacterium]|nr:ECF transporter S component [candidate division KSB1 bacterium]